MLNWIPLQSETQLNQLIERSHDKPCLIFKHSTRCNISSMAKLRLENSWNFSSDEIHTYYLDLIQYRSISNSIAECFNVFHESPQVLLIHNGECTYDASHFDISVNELRAYFS
jgi:bacillithiol system protein YtxJ